MHVMAPYVYDIRNHSYRQIPSFSEAIKNIVTDTSLDSRMKQCKPN